MRLRAWKGILISAGLFPLPASVWATFARVESMGKSATFFMDDVSIFDNPANINVFPNFLIGELGNYVQGDPDREAIQAASSSSRDVFNPRYNRDPQNPWFGGIFSYSLNRNVGGSYYPQLSIAGAFNRRDEELLSLLPDSIQVSGDSATRWIVPEPVTNFDGLLGFTFSNGGMIGSHVYFALQDGANLVNGVVDDAVTSYNIRTFVLKGDVGFNWPLARNIDGELSFGGAAISFGPGTVEEEYSYFLRARAFSTFELINGELVPTILFKSMNAPGRSKEEFDFGLGVNASLDRGFFWLGVEGIIVVDKKTNYQMSNGKSIYHLRSGDTERLDIRGGKMSFGIERNVWWDWLVLRVGGQKEITWREQDKNEGFIYTNPISDGTPNDHVGFGIGVNVEEKLKVDATLAEDVVFSGGNLLSGPHHHIISRVSATYSF